MRKARNLWMHSKKHFFTITVGGLLFALVLGNSFHSAKAHTTKVGTGPNVFNQGPPQTGKPPTSEASTAFVPPTLPTSSTVPPGVSTTSTTLPPAPGPAIQFAANFIALWTSHQPQATWVAKIDPLVVPGLGYQVDTTDQSKILATKVIGISKATTWSDLRSWDVVVVTDKGPVTVDLQGSANTYLISAFYPSQTVEVNPYLSP